MPACCAGIRSEGDRRRSYLTLVPGVLEELMPATGLTASRIVFVCTENSARSQLAAAIWAAASAVPATSAGTHPAADSTLARGRWLDAGRLHLVAPDARADVATSSEQTTS